MADLCPECMRTGSQALLKAIEAALDGALPDPSPEPRVTVSGLLAHAAQLSGVPLEDILGRCRRQVFVRIRHAVSLIAADGPLSLPQIGRAMGGRDHSTVSHGRDRARDRSARDPDYGWFVERLRAAGECEPCGPERPGREIEIATEFAAYAPPPRPKPEPDPNGADDDESEADAAMAMGTRRLLEAIHSAHPDVVPMLPRYVRSTPSMRAGCVLAGVAA